MQTGATLQFTGRENDGTGLLYYRARYYAPGMGRFVSEDPLGFGGGDVNLYGYVGGGPTNFTDAKGTSRLLKAAISGAALGVIGTETAALVYGPNGHRLENAVAKKTLIAAGSNAALGAVGAVMSVGSPEILRGCVGILLGSSANFEYFISQRATGEPVTLEGMDWALKAALLACLGTFVVSLIMTLWFNPEQAVALVGVFSFIDSFLQVAREVVDSYPEPSVP